MSTSKSLIQEALLLLMLLTTTSSALRSAQAQGSERLMVEQHFVPTGWIGDGQLNTELIRLLEACEDQPYSEPICTKISYDEFGQRGWGGIYWQNKPDNWGTEPGMDLSRGGYKSIVFWAKGERGFEYIEFLAGGIEREDLAYKDSFYATAGKIFLTREWQKYYIDLQGKNLSSVIGGFCWVASQTGNAQSPTFYIDDMCFTREETPKYDYLDVGRFFTASGWMGDGSLGREHVRLDESCRTNPHSPPACVKVACSSFGSARWGGVYWQNLQDNWGDKPGWDLSADGYRRLTFWARGDKGSERVEFKAGGIRDRTKLHKDSFEASIGRTVLTKEWRQYVIDLEGKDLSSVIGGFCWVASQPANPKGLTFYLDDIRFEKR